MGKEENFESFSVLSKVLIIKNTYNKTCVFWHVQYSVSNWPNLETYLHRSVFTLTWKPIKGSQATSADPDQTPHDVVSDQDVHCLLKGFSIKKLD